MFVHKQVLLVKLSKSKNVIQKTIYSSIFTYVFYNKNVHFGKKTFGQDECKSDIEAHKHKIKHWQHHF